MPCLGLAHDTTGLFFKNLVGEDLNSIFLNFQTMPPIYGLNAAGAAMNDVPSLIGIYEAYGDE